MAKPRKSGRQVKVNMQGVESSQLVKEGDYLVTVEEIVSKVSESSGKPMLVWTFVTESGGKLWHNTSLQPQALFNLKNVLIALGQAVPNSTMSLDLDELEGLTCGVTVAHEMYEGKKKARIVDFFPADENDELDEEGDDEEASTEEEAEDEGEEEEEVNLEGMTLPELIEYAEENDIKLSKADKKTVKKVKKAIEEALDI